MIRNAETPSQFPCVGLALNLHGQPQSQLQASRKYTLIFHSIFDSNCYRHPAIIHNDLPQETLRRLCFPKTVIMMAPSLRTSDKNCTGPHLHTSNQSPAKCQLGAATIFCLT